MDYDKASRYWTDRAEESLRMPDEELLSSIEAFILARNTCALATASLDGAVRCTPLEYTYKDGFFFFISEGGLKFRGLKDNKRAALSVFDGYEGFGRLNGLQAEGYIELIDTWSEEYTAFMVLRGLPVERMREGGISLHLLRFKPERYDFLCSGLKDKGYDSRQHLDLT